MHDRSDQELLSLLQSGDRGALAELYRRYKRGLYSFCMRLLADTESAEDAVHETFMKLIAGSATISHPPAVKSWLYRVARNEALMTLRRSRNDGSKDWDSVWDNETPLAIAERADMQSIVHSALGRLRVEYREVLILREFDAFSYEEIATVTGDSASSVKSRLFKARKALAGELSHVWKEERENR